MSAKDAVIPFVFESMPVRGAIVQLERTWQRMQRDHNYADPVAEVLGHSAAATALIAQSLKFDGTITFQINGEGPLTMLVMQSTDDLDLRAGGLFRSGCRQYECRTADRSQLGDWRAIGRLK